MSTRNKLLESIVLALGGTVTNPNNRNRLLQDWLNAVSGPVSVDVLYLSGSDIITIDNTFASKVSVSVRVLDDSAPRVLFSSVASPSSYAYIINGTIICNEAAKICVDGFETSIYPNDGNAHTVEIEFDTPVNVDRFGLSQINIFSLTGQILKFSVDSELFNIESQSTEVTGSLGTVATISGGSWSQYQKSGDSYSGPDDFVLFNYNVDQFFTGLFIAGQSNGKGAASVITNDVEYAGQNKRYEQGIVGGPLLDQKEYLNETIASGMTNQLALVQRELSNNQFVTITENHAVGGRDYEAIKKGGTEPDAYAKFITELTSIQAIKQTDVKCINLVHGEADLQNPWVTYRDNLIQFLTDYTEDCKNITGQSTDPIMIVSQISSQQVYTSDVNTVNSPLSLLDVCRQSQNHYSCGPQYWCQTNGAGDYVHLNGQDQVISGEYRAKVYRQVVIDGDTNTPTATIVKSASISGNKITVVFDVPKPPLIFDASHVPQALNQGFSYSDGSGNTISSVQIVNQNTVEITLTGNAGVNPDLQYAWFNGTNGINGIDGGPRGNLCDSEVGTSDRYPSYVMRNYALSFRFANDYLSFT